MQQHGTMLAAAAIALIGQFLNAHPKFPTWAGKIGLLAIGVGWYAVNWHEGHPWPVSFAAWLDWLEAAITAGAALPGAASLVALIPALKTRSQPNP